MRRMSLIVGFHPVREALRAGLALERIALVKGAGRSQEIVDMARKCNVPVRFETRESLDRMSKGAAHQGILAIGAAERYVTLEEVAERAELLVVLDGVEDPHNLGAVVRTAHAAGASGVVIPERRAVGLTETVSKAAAGALAWLPVVRVTNINRALEKLKESGFWIYGLDERGAQSYAETDFAAKAVIVLGAEGGGLHQQVKEHCDFLLKIPMAGEVASLNVSVATGVVLFEWRRRRSGR